mmetsp:Transcript_4799/g.14452  ORF Transcript_4799/g.14452 Transcript_4799/m.14452 type:complete len:259 (-) Transcript_4799:200-976(-)
MGTCAQESEAVALLVAHGLDAVKDAGRRDRRGAEHAGLAVGRVDGHGQAHGRAAVALLDAHGEDVVLEGQGNPRVGVVGGHAHMTVAEVGGVGSLRERRVLARGLLVAGNHGEGVAEGDRRQFPERRQLGLLYHDGDVSCEAQDLQDREGPIQAAQGIEGILQLDGALMHLVQSEMRQLTCPRVLRAAPARVGQHRHRDVLPGEPPLNVRASDDLAVLMDLAPQDGLVVVCLKVHPEVDPSSAREGRDEDAAVLTVEL